MAHPIALVRKSDPQRVVETLEKMLASAKLGEIDQLVIVATKTDGNFVVDVSDCVSRMKLIGALEFAKQDILDAE